MNVERANTKDVLLVAFIPKWP